MDALRDRARETGPKTFEVIRRMFDEAKVEEQPMQTAGAILSIADIYSPQILEKVTLFPENLFYFPLDISPNCSLWCCSLPLNLGFSKWKNKKLENHLVASDIF